MNKTITAKGSLPGFVLAVVAGMLFVATASAEPVTLNLTSNNVIDSVPAQEAVWLFGASLLGLAGIARRRNNRSGNNLKPGLTITDKSS